MEKRFQQEEIFKDKTEKLKQEEAPSLESLVAKSMERIEKESEIVVDKGSERVEKVRNTIGVSAEMVKEEKEKMVFKKRERHILDKFKDLAEETKDKIKLILGKEIVLKEEDIEILEEEYEPFDAELGLQRVKKVVESDTDPDLKGRELKKYKKELMTQKEGVAKLQKDLRKSIEKNPEITVEELMEKVDLHSSHLRLTEKQKEFFKEFIETYNKKHKAIKANRERYPDDKELFKECFGFEARGKIKVEQGPMSFYFKCFNMDDFAKAFVAGSSKDMDLQKIKKTTLGVSKSFSKIPELEGLLLLENSKKVSSSKSRSTRKHEEQHLFFRLFKEQHIRQDMFDKLFMSKTAEEREQVILPYLRFLREGPLERISKNEVLAYYKGEMEPSNIFKHIKDSYDFTEARKEFSMKSLERLKVDEDVAKELVEKVFGKKEYEAILKKSINAILTLEKLGKKKDEIIELLTAEPFERWSNVARRMKQTKKG